MNAFKSQQHRWAKGSIQTARKLLPTILRSELPFAVKREAFFHLTNNLAYLLMVLLSVLMPLSMVVRFNHGLYAHAVPRPAVLHDRHRLGVLLLRGHPARAGAAAAGSGSSTCPS